MFSRSGVRVEPVADPSRLAALADGLLLCYTGHVRRNVGLIDRQIGCTREGREETLLGMKRLQEMAYAMRDAVQRADLPAVGGLLHDAFVAKQQMNPYIAEDTPIESMLAAARDAGAYGGKVCGAGGGGYLLVAAPREAHPVVRTALEAMGGEFAPFSFVADGCARDTRRRDVGAHAVTHRFALVDRDGTINEERHHLATPDEIALDPRLG